MTIPVSFCPSWPTGTPNLLGMEGFFDQLLIALEHREKKIYLSF